MIINLYTSDNNNSKSHALFQVSTRHDEYEPFNGAIATFE